MQNFPASAAQLVMVMQQSHGNEDGTKMEQVTFLSKKIFYWYFGFLNIQIYL